MGHCSFVLQVRMPWPRLVYAKSPQPSDLLSAKANQRRVAWKMAVIGRKRHGRSPLDGIEHPLGNRLAFLYRLPTPPVLASGPRDRPLAIRSWCTFWRTAPLTRRAEGRQRPLGATGRARLAREYLTA